MADIIHRVGINAPVGKVFEALSTVKGLSGWWTVNTSGSSKEGDSIFFQFLSAEGTEIGSMVMTVAALVADQKVVWKCTSGPEEWIGTDLTFNLHREGDCTIVIFGHRNWKEPVEFMAHCSMKWAIFMLSLKALVETGTGRPSPHDIKIDNWN